jgi:hypothetical protein
MNTGHPREASFYRRPGTDAPKTTVRRKSKTGRLRKIFTR